MSEMTQYDLVIRSGRREVKIELGNHEGWIEQYRELLDSADRLTLVPKPGMPLPVVGVRIPKGAQWIYFVRRLNRMNMPLPFQVVASIYAIGWKLKVGSRTQKHILWVYGNGSIESSFGEDNAEFEKEFLEAVVQQAIQQHINQQKGEQ